ncbi:hypothetical protein BREVNS_1870 [Brevinematales bacterium NS]|nr:hypothetical protein BREVNS_1870 [Brevinematales bacterium NS]
MSFINPFREILPLNNIYLFLTPKWKFFEKFLITFPTGDLKEREKDKEVTPGSKDFCQL